MLGGAPSKLWKVLATHFFNSLFDFIIYYLDPVKQLFSNYHEKCHISIEEKNQIGNEYFLICTMWFLNSLMYSLGQDPVPAGNEIYF